MTATPHVESIEQRVQLAAVSPAIERSQMNCCFSTRLRRGYPNYRLAPETPYPGPVMDCYAALTWLHENAAALQVDRRRIGVYGGSAGGGLAAAVALLARGRREIGLCFQCLLYPMLDDRTVVSTEPNSFAGECVWTHSDNAFGWKLVGPSSRAAGCVAICSAWSSDGPGGTSSCVYLGRGAGSVRRRKHRIRTQTSARWRAHGTAGVSWGDAWKHPGS